MLKRLLGRTPIDVWVIKQVDADLLHLCGRATLAAKPNRKAVLAALERGEFSGAVTMATGGMVLNSRLFRALIPAEALQLLPDGQARWQGRDWLLSQVPQRCWTFEGRLVARPDPTGSGSLVSVEDVTGIRRQVDRSTPTPPGQVVFRPENANEEHRLVAPREDAPQAPRRAKTGREWRGDND